MTSLPSRVTSPKRELANCAPAPSDASRERATTKPYHGDQPTLDKVSKGVESEGTHR